MKSYSHLQFAFVSLFQVGIDEEIKLLVSEAIIKATAEILELENHIKRLENRNNALRKYKLCSTISKQLEAAQIAMDNYEYTSNPY